MQELILHPTDVCQWHALINESQVATQILLDQNTESYLVFLLMRYTQGSRLMESVVALDFLESLDKPRSLQVQSLRDVGDKSLLFCGLFPGIALRKRVSINYFVEMGQAAYWTLSDLEASQSDSDLYQSLGGQFKKLQKILQATQDKTHLFTAQFSF